MIIHLDQLVCNLFAGYFGGFRSDSIYSGFLSETDSNKLNDILIDLKYNTKQLF